MDELSELRRRVVLQAGQLKSLQTANEMLKRNLKEAQANNQRRCRHCVSSRPDNLFIRCVDWGKATSPDGWCYKFRPKGDRNEK